MIRNKVTGYFGGLKVKCMKGSGLMGNNMVSECLLWLVVSNRRGNGLKGNK